MTTFSLTLVPLIPLLPSSGAIVLTASVSRSDRPVSIRPLTLYPERLGGLVQRLTSSVAFDGRNEGDLLKVRTPLMENPGRHRSGKHQERK